MGVYYSEVLLLYVTWYVTVQNFPDGADGKMSAYNAGDPGSIPGSGRSPAEGNGNPLQFSCLRIPLTEEPGRLQSVCHTESDA